MFSHIRTLTKTASLALVAMTILLIPQSADAVIEGSNRERMEYLDYGETLIRDALYAKKGNQTFSKDQKKYIRGITNHNEPHIYEPDRYTWELSMQEHKKRLQDMAPPELPDIKLERESKQAQKKNKKSRKNKRNKKKNAEPAMMATPYFGYPQTLPDNPMPNFGNGQYAPQMGNGNIAQQGFMVQPYSEQALIPNGQQMTIQSTPALPGNAQETMNNMIYRARARGIYPTDQLQGAQIRKKLGKGTTGYSYDSAY